VFGNSVPDQSQSVASINFVELILLGEVVSTCFAPVCFVLIILLIADGLLPQCEMILVGGLITVPMLFLKGILILLVALSAVVGGWKSNLFPLWPWFLFAGYPLYD
jgi:hypothetical protein